MNRQSLKLACGNLASQFFPAKKRALVRGEHVPRGVVEKLINASLIERAAKSGDHGALRGQLSSYWQGAAGTDFYSSFADRYENWFLGPHYSVVETLQEWVATHEGQFGQLFEMGCGDGRVLQHLADTLNGLSSFTGIDLNPVIIEKNQSIYPSDRLRFIAGDATQILTEAFTCGSILMSYGGVMEYFLESELVDIFRMMRTRSPAVVALVEPLYDGYNLESEVHSRTGGGENSFSHNYPHLLQEAGFEIIQRDEIRGEFNWMLLVAVAR